MNKLNQIFFVGILFAFLQCFSAQVTEPNMYNSVVVSNASVSTKIKQAKQKVKKTKRRRGRRRRYAPRSERKSWSFKKVFDSLKQAFGRHKKPILIVFGLVVGLYISVGFLVAYCANSFFTGLAANALAVGGGHNVTSAAAISAFASAPFGWWISPHLFVPFVIW